MKGGISVNAAVINKNAKLQRVPEACADTNWSRKQKEIDLVLGRRAKEQKVDGEKGLIFITRNGTPINSRNFGKALDGLVKAYNRKEVINAESEHRDPVLLPHINPHGRVIIRTS